MRVVLDSNVLLAAFGARGLCEAVFTLCLASHEIVISEHILSEVERHLEGKFKASPQLVSRRTEFLRERCLLVTHGDVPMHTCRDPDDLAVLGTAIAGGVDCIVTGDQDLLVLGRYREIEIISPRAFYERIKDAAPGTRDR